MALRAWQKSDTGGAQWRLERPRSLRDQVYDRLRSAILSGEMAAGAAVIEADIATRLGASRTVLFFIGEYRIADNTRSHFYAAGFTSR